MARFYKGALLAGIASLAFASVASAQLTSADAKCETSVSKASSKFVGAKTKCASKCISNAAKGLNPATDCYAPYGGTTAQCVDDTVLNLKGAEDKFGASIAKACDAATKPGADCPECSPYNGDCSLGGFAGDQVQSIEGQVDSFGPGVFCEPGGDPLELKCELNTAKVLAKLVKSINTCFEKCYAGARKVPPTNSVTDCAPPGAGLTGTCVNTASNKAIAGVDKKCRAVGETTKGANDGLTAVPDCGTPDANNYPPGAAWVNLVGTAISGNVPNTFCSE